ncbi:MAG: CHAT domain-containing protein [Gemmataceae bacterium]|nr:CHAT domain-containing protein [Gemmataceae bacterium]
MPSASFRLASLRANPQLRPKIRKTIIIACESGVGSQTTQGEGILRPHRTLEMAGVQSIIAARWKADDEATRLLMERFDENLLAKKLGIGESPREAQVWLMRDGESAMSESTLRIDAPNRRSESTLRGTFRITGGESKSVGSARRRPSIAGGSPGLLGPPSLLP